MDKLRQENGKVSEESQTVSVEQEAEPARLDTATYLLSLVGLLVASVLLYLFAAQPLGSLALVGLTACFSWLIYGYLNGKRRMWRHAILSHVTLETSRVRETFWESALSKTLHLALAILAALAILVVMHRLQPADWTLLFLSLFSFFAFFLYFERKLTNEIVPQYRVFTSLSLAYWLNLGLILIASSIYHLYFVEFADTRSLSLAEVVNQAFAEGAARTHSETLGVLLGVDALLREGSMHLMQVATTEAQIASSYKLLAWLAFFVFMALQFGIVWLLLLGSMIFVIQIRQQGWSLFEHTGVLKPAFLSLGAFFLVGLTVFQVSQLPSINTLQQQAQYRTSGPEPMRHNAVVMPPSTPVNGQAQLEAEPAPQCIPEAFKKELAGLEGIAAQHRQQLRTTFEEEFDLYLAQTRQQWIQGIEGGVDHFLDWNFSVQGQYLSLLHWLIGYVPGDPLENPSVQLLMEMANISENQLHPSLEALIEQRMQAHIDPNVEGQLAGIERHAETALQPLFTTASEQLEHLFAQAAQIDPLCLQGQRPEIDLAGYFENHYTGIGASASMAFLMAARHRPSLATRATQQRAAQTAGRQAATRNISRIPRNIAATKGASYLARAASSGAVGTGGAICGPLAGVCIGGLAITTFVVTEIIAIHGAEALYREGMRAEILTDFEQDIDQLLEQVRDLVLADLDEALAVKQEYQEKHFNAFRDGVRL